MAFNFEKVRENIERAASEPEGFLKHPKRKEFEQMANEALERCSYKAGWRQMYQDEILQYRGLDRLTNILTLADGNVEGWRVIDLGCGSPNEGWPPYHHKGWLPYKAEVLNYLGAKVVGVDYRPNPSASYEHRAVDFGDFVDTGSHCFSDVYRPPKRDDQQAKKKLESDFDLVIATSLVNDGLTNDDNGYETLIFLLGICAKPQQVQYFDSFRRLSGELHRRYIWNLKRKGIEIRYDGGDSIGIKE